MAFAVYGMAVVVAPAIGPTLGGWITDNFSWRWIFYINVPIGVLSLFLTHRLVEDPPYLNEERARGRVRVIAGAGSNSTSQAIELTRRAEAACADAVLSVVPYYNKPMQSGIFAHFRAIADHTSLPIILHDVPARTVRELADDTLARLAESAQFIGLRDGTGDLARPLRLRPLLPPAFRMFSGDDTTALAFVANGGDGCISLVWNIAPDLCRAIFSSCRQGRLQSARYLQSRLAPLTAALANESPAALKYALCLLGFISPGTRLPIVELTEAAKAEVAGALAAIGDEDLVCPVESWHDHSLCGNVAATS